MEWQTKRYLLKTSIMIQIIFKETLYYFPKGLCVILICLILFYGTREVISIIFPNYLVDLFTYGVFIAALLASERAHEAYKKRNDLIFTLEKNFNILAEIEHKRAKLRDENGSIREKWELLSLHDNIKAIVKKQRKNKDRDLQIKSLYDDFKYPETL